MTRRVFISAKRRVALLKSKMGVCHLCGGKITPVEAWDVSHVIPLQLGGADDESNWDTAHRKCHRAHTATTDIPNIAKAKVRETKHLGATPPPRRPIRSAGFPKSGTKPDKLPLPPRRSIYQ